MDKTDTLEKRVDDYMLHWKGDIITDDCGIIIPEVDKEKMLRIAQHFYNYALEDVKREIRNDLDVLDKVERLGESRFEMGWNRGIRITLMELEKFIEKLC